MPLSRRLQPPRSRLEHHDLERHMLQRVMVPLDGTPFAEAALPAAFLLARRDQARVHLVRVHEQHFPAAVPGYPPGYDFTFDQALESEGRRYLDVLLGRID